MNPGMTKRQREMARRQRQQEKSARKQQRQQEKKDRVSTVAAGEDPDLAGIVAGPQPREDEDLDAIVGLSPAEDDEEG
jgi:hypothetical protein